MISKFRKNHHLHYAEAAFKRDIHRIEIDKTRKSREQDGVRALDSFIFLIGQSPFMRIVRGRCYKA